MELVLASDNPGKLDELPGLLATLPYRLRSQSEFGLQSAPETGASFVENALLKARHVCVETGRAAIADDSGLVVDALDGAPGIFSARYAGAAASDQDNVEKLLRDLEGVAADQRQCSFVCVMVCLRHARDPLPLISVGRWCGQVLERPRGSAGFGYDPIFHVAQFDCAAAELDRDTKNRVSHRARAVTGLLDALHREPL